MPVILETIDAIARRLKRDVIFLDIAKRQDRLAHHRPEVTTATAWLDAEGIGWAPCFRFLPGMVILEGGRARSTSTSPSRPAPPCCASSRTSSRSPTHSPANPT
jgi:hypothetical protein